MADIDVTLQDGAVINVEIISCGPQGPMGPAGAVGVGIASIAQTGHLGRSNQYTITLTNGNTFSFTVVDGKNGATGETGPAGSDGADGVSPEVTITSITGGHTVTITDADHPSGQSFNVMDGVSPTVDATLTTQGAAADAKKTGDELSDLKSATINAASIDNAGLISYKHGNTQLFTLQLPLYSGGVT